MDIHIAIAAETLGHFLGLTITNSFLTSIIVVTIILAYAFVTGKSLKLKKPSKNQTIVELITTGLYSLSISILGKKHSKAYFPIIFSFFIFILMSNWFGLLPFVNGIKYTPQTKIEEIIEGKEIHEAEAMHLFRAPTSDLNTTLAVAIVSVFLIQFAAIKELGLGNYSSKFFNFKVVKKGVMGYFEAGINSFVGILELLSEFTKIISFSFRLFGNIFAGEVLIIVISALTYSIGTLPFLGLEVFVGLIQAFVFTMLTLVFLSVSISSHNNSH
ncbi:MAG: F0F1 ATP synthase subunit A [bacterium]|nr:F0F1 ATP synthase subunit A [bacterium]